MAQLVLTWTASTDNVAVTAYFVERCQGVACGGFAQVTSIGSTTWTDVGLLDGTTYRYRVRAGDAAGNLSAYSNIATATTPAAVDTIPPTDPSNLLVTSISTTQINVSWTGSTDNIGVTAYLVERCQGVACTGFVQVTSTPGLTFNNTGLSSSTTYRYRVRAIDAAGNASGYSNIVSATTSAVPDTSAPTAPSSLVGTVISQTEIDLTWAASNDNVGVTAYFIEQCQGAACTGFTQITTTTSLAFPVTGLTTNTTYRWRVRATDAANNLSAYSNIVQATTFSTGDVTPPPVPTGVQVI